MVHPPLHEHPNLRQTAHACLTHIAMQRCNMLDLPMHANIALSCGVTVPCRARRTAMLRAPLTLLHYNDDPIIVDGGEEGWECK